jgi:3-oxoacyl-[acyl-carrier-protein] synthase II
MSDMMVVGWSALTSAGSGVGALAHRLAGADAGTRAASPGVPVGHLWPEPLPAPTGHALVDFDIRGELGRKGTSSFDRATGLSVVCCREALREARLDAGATDGSRVGVALGTSLGSFKSTSDYTRETLVQEKPYLVNPMLFPNTVMNCAAGQVAIRFGLRGVNATIAGGPLAFLNAVRYARNVFDRGYADVMLTGAVEEYTPHRAWAAHLTGTTGGVAAGEAAAVFVLCRPDAPAWPGRRALARIRAVATGFGPGGEESARRALTGCVARALRQSGVDAIDVTTVVTGESDEADRREYRPAARALGHEPRRVLSKRLLGECDAAAGAVALAVFLAGEPGPTDARSPLCLITGRGPDGAVGAAIVERYPDAGADRG